ncbi:hypothetical protein B0H11DRAFT_1731990 [Mycena galericulata]|nr:hypothetical protein B0H11DRAFT_1731990 [Mycena galericulata]
MHAPLKKTDEFDVSSLVGQGLFPCSPFAPKLAIATRVLEVFRVARLRSLTLSIQGWVKSLCDLHGRAYIPYLSQQFTICFDLYLETLKTVDQKVAKVLGRDAADWRLKNCCPSCTYKLEGEQKLIFSMLVAMDGNNSLKRVLRKDGTFDDAGNAGRGKSERQDPRTEEAGGDYFVSREKVDLWSKELLAELSQTSDDPEEKTACEERWKNLSDDLTARMWGVFDETGVFLALCRHGFVLLLADMVRSGELNLWPFIVDALLDAFGPDVGDGYDVGCGLESTIKKTPLKEKAERLNFKSLVGAFHGHAHNRLCQLTFLATYVPGLGLEDLEGCERFFSQSNALSRSTRYASIFHRRQSIATYLAHTDVYDTYANLSSFLVNNYKQVLEILDSEGGLYKAMDEMGIDHVSEFQDRLDEEQEYLKALGKEPDVETNHMEYLQHLVKLMDKRYVVHISFYTSADLSCPCSAMIPTLTTSTKVAQRHARESYECALAEVEESENKMEILVRWMQDNKEWDKAAELLNTRRYRLCINELEVLVLKRMFELTKMNMSGTGYKMWRHIAKALQTRSHTIRNALTHYNNAADALQPPRHHLSWDEVVNYTFLSEWDLLRDPEGNADLVLDTYFKIERAKEEIKRLDVEIRQLVTYIRDEKEFLDRRTEEVRATDPDLAFFICKYQWRRGRFDAGHMARLQKMVKKLGSKFTGTLEPGQHILPQPPEATTDTMEGIEEEARDAAELQRLNEMLAECGEEDDDGWEDIDREGEVAEDEELARMLEMVMTVSGDGGAMEDVGED